jgi:hypothetical protein
VADVTTIIDIQAELIEIAPCSVPARSCAFASEGIISVMLPLTEFKGAFTAEFGKGRFQWTIYRGKPGFTHCRWLKVT